MLNDRAFVAAVIVVPDPIMTADLIMTATRAKAKARSGRTAKV
jgi:hypothetical protein